MKSLHESIVSKDVLFGFLKYPHRRETPIPTAFDWLSGKRFDDDIEKSLWRIHNKLYDFNGFKHPGGESFITLTKGTDTTELFESSHPNIEKAEAMLEKYYVRDELKPRNTATFTFDKNGFYCKLRSKAWKILKSNQGPSEVTTNLHDLLLILFLSFMALSTSTLTDSVCLPFIIAGGLVLALLANCAHNFFHQKDNWRMYSFDLTTHSSYEWRVTHVYSHHSFPNTINDYEITAFEPFVRYLPLRKGFLVKVLSAICMVVVFGLAMFMVVSAHGDFRKLTSPNCKIGDKTVLVGGDISTAVAMGKHLARADGVIAHTFQNHWCQSCQSCLWIIQ